MPHVQRYNPAYVVAHAEMVDLNTAGGDSGTATVQAPFNCFVSWIGYSGAAATDTASTLITLAHSTQGGYAGSPATGTVLSIPSGTAANTVVHAEISPAVVGNYFQAGEPIIIVSGGQTAIANACDFVLVLEPD